jgi:hypothetical protein
VGYDPKAVGGLLRAATHAMRQIMVFGAQAALEVGDVLDRIRELTGIYGLGFRRESILGLVVPIAFVLLVGGAIAGLILFRL